MTEIGWKFLLIVNNPVILSGEIVSNNSFIELQLCVIVSFNVNLYFIFGMHHILSSFSMDEHNL